VFVLTTQQQQQESKQQASNRQSNNVGLSQRQWLAINCNTCPDGILVLRLTKFTFDWIFAVSFYGSVSVSASVCGTL
jgi:hypothetical protein